MFGIARTTGRSGAAASTVAIRTPAAIEITSVSRPRLAAACSSAAGTSPGFTATTTTSVSATAHAGLGADADAREALLEHAPPVGVDLGDRERLRVPARRRGDRTAVPHPCDHRRAGRARASREGNAQAHVGTGRRRERRLANEPEEPSSRPRTSPNGADRHAPRARSAGTVARARRYVKTNCALARRGRLVAPRAPTARVVRDVRGGGTRGGRSAGTTSRRARRARR